MEWEWPLVFYLVACTYFTFHTNIVSIYCTLCAITLSNVDIVLFSCFSPLVVHILTTRKCGVPKYCNPSKVSNVNPKVMRVISLRAL